MKKFLTVLLAIACAFALVACGTNNGGSGSESGTDAYPTELSDKAFGHAVKYDPELPVNNGEEITLDYWLWTSDAIWQSVVDAYTAIHPNVHINIINNNFDDFFIKLAVAIGDENGPTLFNMHSSYKELVFNNMAPYAIPIDELKADYNGVEQHIEADGNVYYLDIGYMTGSIFYNKAMWEAAGLTDADIPTTWDEFFEVAKKLTIKDADGNITQAGWNCQNYVNSNYIMGLGYQLGQGLFNEDMKTANINNEANIKIMQMLLDNINSGEITNMDYTNEALVSFATGGTAMISSWGWLNDYLNANFPDLDFGVFEIPVFDTSNIYGYNRTNTECTMGINGNATEAQQAVAQDFVRFFLASDECMAKVDLGYSTFPSKKALANDESIMANKALAAVKDHITQYVNPGPLPATFETNLKIMEEDVFYNGMDIAEALQKAEDAINADLADIDFVSIENQYKK